ncbi:MAG: aspartyl/asparaginyl beta-hydroxylase domain-containing protein [Chitinophagales bacterium]|nr:aspartyl/asparaginyl beta-hydroxylase domain-containing protein [Chitinophagales bacterium]
MTTNEPFYYITKEWYKGGSPAFYENSEYPLTHILEEHADMIVNEVISFYTNNGSKTKNNFVPYNLDTSGWQTLVLYSGGVINKENLQYLPKTWELLKDYPGLSLLMVSVLKPGTRLSAHFGDTDAIVRNHLGVLIPEPYPAIGLRIKNEERGWEVGKVLSFCVVNRHYAWNYTNKARIILMVDFVKPEFIHRKQEIEGKILAAEAMKLFATKIPITKKLPNAVVYFLHGILGRLANIYVRLFKQ